MLNVDKPPLFDTLKKFDIDITEYRFVKTSIDDVFGNMPDDFKKDLMQDIEDMLVASRLNDKSGKENALFFNGRDIVMLSLGENDKPLYEIAKMQHGDLGEYLLSEESDGTRRLIELLDIHLSEKMI